MVVQILAARAATRRADVMTVAPAVAATMDVAAAMPVAAVADAQRDVADTALNFETCWVAFAVVCAAVDVTRVARIAVVVAPVAAVVAATVAVVARADARTAAPVAVAVTLA